MKKTLFICAFFLALLFSTLPAAAQNPFLAGTPFILPQTVFVGDSGLLVVPLGQIFEGVEPFVMYTPEELPEATEELLIRRIELERRGGVSRLLIDFVPYAPGPIFFPSIELPSILTVPPITGLTVNVSSILDPSQISLSDPAPPLVVPGTNLLIYGSIALVLIVFALGAWISIWGRRNFGRLWKRLRRRYLLRLMLKFLRRIKQEGSMEVKESPGFYLSLLSTELREFLSQFTGLNCRPLSAVEFLNLNLEHNSSELSSIFLCQLFRSWDNLRFSGRVIAISDLTGALDETESFITALDRAEKEKLFKKPFQERLQEEQCT